MRIIKLPADFDMIIELTSREWEEMRTGLNTDLLLRRNENTVIARVGGSWIMILLREEGREK